MEDTDQDLKKYCLEAALRVCEASRAVSVDPGSAEMIVQIARVFESYLREDATK